MFMCYVFLKKKCLFECKMVTRYVTVEKNERTPNISHICGFSSTCPTGSTCSSYRVFR